jgi:hypothetical protein
MPPLAGVRVQGYPPVNAVGTTACETKDEQIELLFIE